MKLIRPVVLMFGFACTALPMLAQARKTDNPVYGTWTWNPEGKDCQEVYVWRPDGTGHVTSGKEITETQFKVSDTPDENGFYVFLDHVVKDNRGKDCAGSTKDDTGHKSTFYIQINPDADMLRICFKASEDACIGPLTKVPSVEI